MDRRLRVLVLVVAVTIPSLVPAEDVEHRWRISLALGGYNSLDETQSNSANELTLIDRALFEAGKREVVDFYRDPRDDNAAFGALDVQAGPLATLAVQFAVTKMFLVEASVGYHKADLGDVELSARLANDPPPIEEINFNFRTFHYQVGELERVPIQLDGIFRFRPRAKFNPYFGGGIGYSFVGFEPTDEINQLSFDLDTQIGRDCRLTSSFLSESVLVCDRPFRDLQGIKVDAGDSFEWNVVAGAEISVKRKMAIIIDLRYVKASREIAVQVDGSNELGSSVPQLVDFNDSIAGLTGVNGGYGAVQVGSSNDTDVGLVDIGYRILTQSASNPTANCNFPNPNSTCVAQLVDSPGSGFLIQNFKGEIYEDTDPGNGDGRRDPGEYYVQGGSFGWDGLSLQVGFRYTF